MKQFAVIGLGQFGLTVAKVLIEKGHEVLAIDSDEEKVDSVAGQVTQAVIADATDKSALSDLVSKDIDVAIVSLGDKIDASVLVTLYLKEIGVKNIIVKAVSGDHGKILEAIGATEVVYPERDMALKIAENINNPNIIDHIPLSPEYAIEEIAPLQEFIGKTIGELRLRSEYGLQVIAVKQVIPERMELLPDAGFRIKDSDLLVVIGREQDLKKFSK